MTTALVHDPLCKRHDPGPRHPEVPARYDAAVAGARAAGPVSEPAPRIGTEEDVLRIHTADYLRIVKEDVVDPVGALRTGDTDVCAWSLDAALRAVGCALTAVDLVMDGAAANAFCPVRPPGHHATANRGMGFCVFNNIAVAARHLRQRRGVDRVLIVDWDVHHGNGTQAIFERDPSVFYFSTHQWPLYPGSGQRHEAGAGEGRGHTVNCPMAAGCGASEILDLMRSRLAPVMRTFRPQFVLLSAGFDGHGRDPIGGLCLRDEDYGALTGAVAELAAEHADGRLVSLLEGGYHLEALERSVAAHAGALLRAGGEEPGMAGGDNA